MLFSVDLVLEHLGGLEHGGVVVLTKDLSRLGRNSTMTGMFINITFAKHGVRYIAVNDNFDTQNQNSVDYDFGGIEVVEYINHVTENMKER